MSSDSTNGDPDARVVNVSPDGRTTIPEHVREALGVETTGRVRFERTSDGRVVVVPVPDLHPDDGPLDEGASAPDDSIEDVEIPPEEAAAYRCGRWGDERWR